MIIALFPAFIAVPKFVFGRIESGWGFVSRITDRGLRMRRGLANTRTDNIASGRIQRLAVRRPLLWRAPDWTAVSVTVAGIEDDSENGAQNVLPVGTRDELGATLGHLAAPLGTADDLATLEHLLSAPAPGIEGLRKPLRLYWIARRTQVAVLLPGALVHRTGILGRSLEIIPRERIQHVSLSDGPLGQRLGLLDLEVGWPATPCTSPASPAPTRSPCAVLARAAARCAVTVIVPSGPPRARRGAHRPPTSRRPTPAAPRSRRSLHPAARRRQVNAPRLGIGIIGAGGAPCSAPRCAPGPRHTGAYAVSDASAPAPPSCCRECRCWTSRSSAQRDAAAGRPRRQLAPLAAGIAATGMIRRAARRPPQAATAPTCWPRSPRPAAPRRPPPAMTFTGTAPTSPGSSVPDGHHRRPSCSRRRRAGGRAGRGLP